MLKLSQETVQLQEVPTLPCASSRSLCPCGQLLIRAPSQDFVTGRQDTVAVVGNRSKRRKPISPPRRGVLQKTGNLLK
jgi:hypothetical protein